MFSLVKDEFNLNCNKNTAITKWIVFCIMFTF
jgi:hypothetical protein